MVVPKSSGELISLGGVNWHEPLADYYSKHAQQLERHLADSVAQRNRKAAIKAEESGVKTFQKVGQTFSALVQAKNAMDQRSAANDAKELKKEKDRLKNLPFYIENQDDLNAKLKFEHDFKKKDLLDKSNKSEEGVKYRKLIAKLQENAETKPAAVELLNASGRTLIAMQEMMARDAIAGTSPSTFMNDVDWVEANPKLIEKWDASDKNSDTRDAIFKQYQLDKIAHLNLNDETKAAVLGKELSRQSRTAKNINTASAVNAVTTAEDRKVLTQLKTAQRTGSLEDAVWSVRDQLINSQDTRFAADDFQTTNQKVDEYLYQTLSDLATDGFITESELQPYIDSGFAHPAGKDGVGTPGELLFSKEQVNGLVRAARSGTGRHVAVQMSIATNELAALKTAALRGEDVTAQLQDIEHKFPELKEKIDDVRNTNVKDNTPEAYAVEKEDWEIELENGNIVASKEAAKLIKNEDLKKEVLAKIALHEKVRERVNYSERWIDIKVAEGMNLTLEADDPLNERGIKVRNDLLKYFRKDFQRRIEADPDNPEALNESIRAVEDYWINNGGKNKDQKPTVKGKFTVTNNGRYEAYDKYSGLVSKRRQNALLKSNVTNVKTWDNEVNQAWKLARDNPQFGGRNTLERMVRTPGLLSPDDIIGAYENGVLSQEIITKARRIGIEPTTLLKGQTLALQESDDKELLNVLGQSQIDSFPNKGELLYDAIKRSGKGDLIYLMNRVGPENWTANQFQRVRNELAKQAEFQSNIKTQTEEGINQIEQERRPETYTGPTY